jgi:hypothetical protein
MYVPKHCHACNDIFMIDVDLKILFCFPDVTTHCGRIFTAR